MFAAFYFKFFQFVILWHKTEIKTLSASVLLRDQRTPTSVWKFSGDTNFQIIPVADLAVKFFFRGSIVEVNSWFLGSLYI